jgi:hypothetical protein
MDATHFKIVYCPFPGSDVTAEMESFGVNEEKALEWFQHLYPAATVKSVEAI